jgi:hypothetical protein
MAFANGGRIVTDGLVLSLDAADQNSYPGSGTVWNDLSGNNNTGSLTNGPTFSGANGGSLVFNGSNQYANLGNPNSLNIPGSITIESWVYPTDITTGVVKGIASRWENNSKSYKIAILNSTSKFYIDVSNAGTEDIYLQSTQNATINTWYHVVGTYISGVSPSLNIYVNAQLSNGVLIGTIPQSLFSGASLFLVGTDATVASGGNFFTGRIAETRVYNRALSATEVLQNYNAQKSRFNLT